MKTQITIEAASLEDAVKGFVIAMGVPETDVAFFAQDLMGKLTSCVAVSICEDPRVWLQQALSENETSQENT